VKCGKCRDIKMPEYSLDIFGHRLNVLEIE